MAQGLMHVQIPHAASGWHDPWVWVDRSACGLICKEHTSTLFL